MFNFWIIELATVPDADEPPPVTVSELVNAVNPVLMS